jgi:UDP-N-acetyl-D-mannosaminuronate dehydrogenase
MRLKGTSIMSNIKVSMIGCGKLGGPCAEIMSKYYDVVGYDINPV